MVYVTNRFSAISHDETDHDFIELAKEPVKKTTKTAPVNKAAVKAVTIAISEELPGSSSLEKVSNALRIKKLAEADAIAKSEAAAAKLAEDATAEATDGISLETRNRRTGKPNHGSRSSDRSKRDEGLTSRQYEHAHDRETRSNRKYAGNDKKRGAGKGNWGKLIEDQEITTLSPFNNKQESPVSSVIEPTIKSSEPVKPPSKSSSEPKAENTSAIASSNAVQTPIPEPSVITYEQYLAQQSKTLLVINTPRRQANDGSQDKLWKKAVPLVKHEEDVKSIPKPKQEKSSYGQQQKPTNLGASVPSIIIDPRLNLDFSKPVTKPRRETRDFPEHKDRRTDDRTNRTATSGVSQKPAKPATAVPRHK